MRSDATSRRILRLGTRGSQLARWQAEWVADRLRRLGRQVKLVEITTHGDFERGRAIEEIGTRGVFTKEIQRALLAGEVDLGVHSLKDLPTEPVDGLMLAAVPRREGAADALILSKNRTDNPVRLECRTDRIVHPTISLALLTSGASVGTGSLRRQAQLLHIRPDLRFVDVRGNVDTRLRKLDDGQFDAIVLAEAGLARLGLSGRITQLLPMEVMLPAAGQGALGVECRVNDADTSAAVAPLDDMPTRAAVMAERSLLAHLRGGCMAPVGAWGRIENGALHLSAVVLSADGSQRLMASRFDDAAQADALGGRVAEDLLARGAGELIATARMP
jgi:hydroxymethylbilane synthase